MAEVNISINGRPYDIACDSGQEGRIVDLAAYLDQRAQQVARSGGAFNDAHVIVLAALLVADELFEEKEKAAVRPLAATRAQAPAPAPVANKEEEALVVRALDQLAKRIEGIAARVQTA